MINKIEFRFLAEWPEFILDVDAQISLGQRCALMGHSGSGKSTLFRHFFKALEKTKIRHIQFAGEKINPQRISFISQEIYLFPHLTIEENILYGLNKKERDISSQKEWIEILRLGDLLKRFPHEISGGEQQRIALARSLIRKPDLLLLDEPCAHLDPELRENFFQFFCLAQERLKLSCFFSTHYAEEALRFSEHLILLENGKILQSGHPWEVYRHPKSFNAARLLGKVQRWPYLESSSHEVYLRAEDLDLDTQESPQSLAMYVTESSFEGSRYWTEGKNDRGDTLFCYTQKAYPKGALVYFKRKTRAKDA